MDVHAKSTVWCLVDMQGAVMGEGRIATRAPALAALVRALSEEEELLAGQEVGTLTYLVHDAVTTTGTTLLSSTRSSCGASPPRGRRPIGAMPTGSRRR